MKSSEEKPRDISHEVRSQLAPNGKIRLAANLANASVVYEYAPGCFSGPVAELAVSLEAKLGIPVEIAAFKSGGEIVRGSGDWDLAVLAYDPERDQVIYLHEVAEVRATLAGKRSDHAATCEEADRVGARIATAKGAAYESYLSRALQNAAIIPFDNPDTARSAMISGSCDFVAGIRATLAQRLSDLDNVRLMSDDFLSLSQRLAVPAKHPETALLLAEMYRTD